MKKLLVLLAIVLLAMVAMPVIASESIGPPGDVIVSATAFHSVNVAVAAGKAVKEVAPIATDSIVASACWLAAVALMTAVYFARSKSLGQDLPSSNPAGCLFA